MRKLLYFLLAGVFAAGSALADTNVSGTWTGSFHAIGADGEARESTAVLMLKQSGSEITGTAGPNENEQHLAVKGKIEGDKITLGAEDEGRTVHFDLVLAADRITGDMTMIHSGQTAKARIDVRRAK